MATTDFERLISVLTGGRVAFVIIGGFAAIIHGASHVTYDIAICYDRSLENVKRPCDALAPLSPTLRGAPKDLPFRFDAATVLAGLNFTLDTDLGALDLLGEVAPFGTYHRVAESSEERELFGHRVLVLSLDGLIRAKKATGRRRDQLVIPELEALRELSDQGDEG